METIPEFGPQKYVPVQPPVGKWLETLITEGRAHEILGVAAEADVKRTEFVWSDPIDERAAKFRAQMLWPDASEYKAQRLAVYRLRNVSVVGLDQILLHEGQAIRDTVNKIPHWLPGSLTESYVPHERLELRRNVKIDFADPSLGYYIGCEPAWRNYALWMRHTLPRLVVYAQHLSRQDGVRLVLPAFAPGSYQAQTLELLDIPKERVVEVGSEQCLELSHALLMTPIDVWQISPFNAVSAGFLADRVPGIEAVRPARRIYLRRDDGDLRRVVNFDEIAEVLRKFDFEIVEIGKLTVADQIRTMRSATHVVAEHGAGLANVMFCRPGAVVLELFNPACPQPAFWTIASLAGCSFGFLVGEHVATHQTLDVDWNSDYTINRLQLDAALTRITE